MKVNGYICSNNDAVVYQWYGLEAVCPNDIRKAVAECPPGETLTLEINSGGGSVPAGYEMYSVLKGAGCPTVAEIQSIAGSAASVMAVGADRVTATPVGEVMIHLPSTGTEGDAPAHRQAVRALESITEGILNAYELKCAGKKTRAELRRMMESETWLHVQEAVAAGLVDEVLYDEGGVLLPENIVNCVGSGYRALAGASGLPDLERMRAAYQEAMSAERPPAAAGGAQPGGGPEKDASEIQIALAMLELEHMRFGG